MLHRAYGLTSHPDVTRFEVEDGIVRHAAAELLSEETTVDNITIDLGVQVRQGSDESALAAFDTMMSISGVTEADVAPAMLADLIAEVAVIAAASPVEIIEISRLEKPWIGTPTPGPKVTAHVNPAAADSPAFRSGIQELAASVGVSLGDVGARVMFGEQSEAWPMTASISYWFPNARAAAVALEGERFHALVSSSLIQPDSVVLVEAIEHRVTPNPNTWGSKDLDARASRSQEAESQEPASKDAVEPSDPE